MLLLNSIETITVRSYVCVERLLFFFLESEGTKLIQNMARSALCSAF